MYKTNSVPVLKAHQMGVALVKSRSTQVKTSQQWKHRYHTSYAYSEYHTMETTTFSSLSHIETGRKVGSNQVSTTLTEHRREVAMSYSCV